MKGFMCSAPIYEYKGWLFEFSYSIGPWPLRKRDYEPRERAGKKFYDMFTEWNRLTDKEKAATRTGGGCEYFTDELRLVK